MSDVSPPLRAALVLVGDELLAGRVVDANAARAASFLRAEGVPVVFKLTVSDGVAELAAALRLARERADFVLVSGGLGPTADDLTRDGLAAYAGVELEEDPIALGWLEELFARLGRPLTAANRVQALLPRGAIAVRNSSGTACGILLREEEGAILALPGVPAELAGLLESAVPPLLEELAPARPRPATGRVTLHGMSEAAVGEAIRDLMRRGRDPSVGCYPRVAGQVLVVESFAEDGAARVARDLDTLVDRLGDAVVAAREVEMEEVLLELLGARGETLAVAESLTAGRVADRVARVPGASRVFLAGFATYANAAKCTVLGVRQETLERCGAVSEEVAAEMALGARRLGAADWAVSTTGIAGPGGATPGKPVGTVAFGLAGPDGVHTVLRHVPGDREMVRERSAVTALDLLRRHLLLADA